MIGLRLILLVVAIICFVLAAFGVPSRVSWEPIGLAFLAAAFLV